MIQSAVFGEHDDVGKHECGCARKSQDASISDRHDRLGRALVLWRALGRGLDDVALEPAEVLIKILGSNFLERLDVLGGGIVELFLGRFFQGRLEADEGDGGMTDMFDKLELECEDILI